MVLTCTWQATCSHIRELCGAVAPTSLLCAYVCFTTASLFVVTLAYVCRASFRVSQLHQKTDTASFVALFEAGGTKFVLPVSSPSLEDVGSCSSSAVVARQYASQRQTSHADSMHAPDWIGQYHCNQISGHHGHRTHPRWQRHHFQASCCAKCLHVLWGNFVLYTLLCPTLAQAKEKDC